MQIAGSPVLLRPQDREACPAAFAGIEIQLDSPLELGTGCHVPQSGQWEVELSAVEEACPLEAVAHPMDVNIKNATSITRTA